MKRQEIIGKLNKQLSIENYSDQTIKNYILALKLFLAYISKLNVQEVTDKGIQNYLFFCKTEKKYSYSSIYSINKIKSPADKLKK